MGTGNDWDVEKPWTPKVQGLVDSTVNQIVKYSHVEP